ncbi:MAG: molybdopterin cofactor-binding domain-containing protein, partial [Actinomycetota bacterium]|nr:molybdopterin cofactor-binding domain-containing protein [Actinomycetota bacterium]
MAGSILGQQVLRKEDPKFLTTGGEYLADISEPLLEGAAHVVFARSPMAHGTIESIDISEAESMPGVIGIYTAGSLGLEPTKSNFNPGVARTLLASDKVRWVGEPIVAVVAETYAQATDAAQMVFVDIDPLPAVIDMKEALTSSTHIYDGAGSNAVFDSAALGGQPTTGDAFFEGCEVVVSTEALNQRVAPCPLEPRAAAATWHEGRLYEWLSTQHAQGAVGPIAGAN